MSKKSSSSSDSLSDGFADVSVDDFDGLSDDSDHKTELKSTPKLKANQKNCINILLLGETGVGKSTFINGFANYLSYETLKEAKDEQILSLIPASFTVTDPETFDEIVVKLGSDDNEDDTPGASATQGCKSYVFPFGERFVRLIDTPGIGDVRGIDQDKLNFDNILDHISHYEDLHCICILLKPNNARITVTFEFCIKQLLCHLQKSASKNIVFLFTNARSTFYMPGDTAPSLRVILNSVKESPPYVEIPFKRHTTYCLDNEAFRFLIALKNGIHFDKDNIKNFAQSWRKSANECLRLMKYIMGTNDGQKPLIPHKVQDTISVNEARRMIVGLSQPLADIAQNIDDNLVVMERHMNDIKAESSNIENLKGKLYIPQLDLDIIELPHPKTVCANGQCCDVYNVGGLNKYNYKTVCHPHCYLNGVQKEVMGDPILAGCAAMGAGGKCRVCANGCDYKIHLHVYYDTRVIETQIHDIDVEKQIKSKEDVKLKAEKTIRDIEQRSKEMKSEMSVITKITAKFAHFLKNNAIAPYNDAFKAYLEHLIKNEESLSKSGSNNVQTLEGLKRMLVCYEQEKIILDNAMSDTNSDCVVTAKNIFDGIEELYQLRIYGQKIEDSQKKQTMSRKGEQTFKARETVHKPTKEKGFAAKVKAWMT